MTKLRDICTVVSGSTPKTNIDEYWDGDVKWITPAEINEDSFYINDSVRHITEEGRIKTGLSYMPAGTVILSSRAPIGKTAIAGCAMCCNQGFKNLICTDKIFNEYLYFFLKAKTEYLNSLGRGATFKEISKAIVEDIEIPLPDYEEQKQISSQMRKIDSLLTLRKQQLSKLNELIKARFVELFGDPISNSMGWETKRFDSLCENLDSRRKPITASEREAGIYPYYGASGIVDYVADYLFDEDILLVSEDGANLLMRSTPIAFSVSGKVWVNNHAHVVRFEKMNMQKYIEVFFSMIDISEHITGSAQPKLNQAKLNAMMFPVPSDDRLEAFLHFCKQTDKSKSEIQKSLEKLETLKKSLMQKYFG